MKVYTSSPVSLTLAVWSVKKDVEQNPILARPAFGLDKGVGGVSISPVTVIVRTARGTFKSNVLLTVMEFVTPGLLPPHSFTVKKPFESGFGKNVAAPH